MDFEVFLNINGGAGGVRVGPTDFPKFGKLVREELQVAGQKIKSGLLQQLRMAYELAIRERPRREGEHLMQRILSALEGEVNAIPEGVEINVFNLLRMDYLTRNEGRGTEDEGWFNLLEGGNDYPMHGSENWAFVYLDRAKELAEECATFMKLSDAEKGQFLEDVEKNFAGRHGEGIMVDLDKPLFFAYPQFGDEKARNILGDLGHPGFPGLNVLQNYPGIADAAGVAAGAEGDNFIMTLFGRAIERAIMRMG